MEFGRQLSIRIMPVGAAALTDLPVLTGDVIALEFISPRTLAIFNGG